MKKIRISRPYIIAVLALLLVLSCAFTGSAVAKYVRIAKDGVSSVVGKAFYFESDYLTDNDHEYELNAGTTEISFQLRNYENELHVSEIRCTYTVTVTSTDPSFTVNGANETTVILEASANQQVQHTVTLGELSDGYRYSVTVKAEGGYSKTLSAVFSVASQNGFFMDVTDYAKQNYVLLTVWSENVTGTVEITVPNGLIPDGTDPLLSGIKNYQDGKYGSFSLTDTESFAEPFASRSYRFFKTEDYQSAQGFAVTIDGMPVFESVIP